MNSRLSRVFVLLTVTAACAASSFSKDLDAALEAQKKKAQRHVYSESARLDNQKLVVPREPTEEEKAIDKELQLMEARQAAQPASPMQSMPMPVRPVQPAENKNWLTPAMMDDAAALSQTNDTENSWLVREMERQKELKELEAAKAKENDLVEKLLREKQQQTSSPELEQLKKYQLAPQKLFGSKEKDPDAPAYMTPRSGTPDPLVAVGLSPKKEKSAAPALFFPEAARLSASLDKDPLRSAKNPALGSKPGSPVRPARSVFTPQQPESEPVPLTPLEMIRKASPINRPNPFADDHMPQMKTSIWE